MPGSMTPPALLDLASLSSECWLPHPLRRRPQEFPLCRGSITSRFRIPAYEVRSIRLVSALTGTTPNVHYCIECFSFACRTFTRKISGPSHGAQSVKEPRVIFLSSQGETQKTSSEHPGG